MATQMTQDTLNNLEQSKKKKLARGIIIPDFKLHHRDIIIKTTWHWHKN